MWLEERRTSARHKRERRVDKDDRPLERTIGGLLCLGLMLTALAGIGWLHPLIALAGIAASVCVYHVSRGVYRARKENGDESEHRLARCKRPAAGNRSRPDGE